MSDAHDEYRDAMAMALWMLRLKRDAPRFWTKAQRGAFARVVERIEAAAWQPDPNGKLAVAAADEALGFALCQTRSIHGRSKRCDAAKAASDLAVFMSRVARAHARDKTPLAQEATEYMRGRFSWLLLSIKVKQ